MFALPLVSEGRCIGFLVGSRKERIAAQLAEGRKRIRKDLMHEAEEPLPTSKG